MGTAMGGTVLKADTIYVAFDRFVCASVRCAGSTAVASGRNIDGHRLREVDGRDVAEWSAYDLGPLSCECGAVTMGGGG